MLNLMKRNLLIRLISFYVCLMVGMFLTEQTLSKAFEYILSPYSDSTDSIAFRVCNLLVLMLFIQQFHRYCNGISIQETTLLKPASSKLVLGFGLLATVLLALIASILFVAGITTHSFAGVSVSQLLPAIALLLLAALFEQLLLNGVLLVSLLRTMRPVFAVIISAGFFTYLHAGNDHFSLVGAVNTYLAGCLFCLIFLKTHSLWPALAFHVCWNISQSLIFGFNVSGHKFNSIITTHYVGHPLLTGGDYGLESSLVTLAVNVALLFFLITKFTRTTVTPARKVRETDSAQLSGYSE